MNSLTSFRLRWLYLLFIAFLLACTGCESKPTQSATPQSTTPQTRELAATDSPLGNGSAGAAPKTIASSRSASPLANKTASIPVPSVEPERASVKPDVPKPTAEQIARWKPVEFEPLQLLDIRDDGKSGYIANIESVGDGEHFVTSGAKLMKWSIDSEQPPQVLMEIPPEDAQIVACKVSPKGDFCVILQKDNWCRVFSLTSGKELVAKQLELKSPEQLTVSIDASEIAILCQRGKLSLWHVNDLTEKARWEIDTGEVSQLEYIRANVLVAAGKTTSSWDTTTGKMLKTFTDISYLQCAVKSQDSVSWLALGNDQFIHWRCADDEKLGTVNSGYAKSAIMRFSPDANRLAALDGEKIQIWDIARNQVLQTIDHTGNAPVSMAWLPKSNQLIVASFDGNLRFWGDATLASKFGTAALAAPPVEGSARPGVPATTAECLATIDLRSLARFPGSKMPVDHPFQCYGTLPTTADEARLYYQYLFYQLGWKSIKIDANYPSLRFEKNGFLVDISIGSVSPQETNVGLSNLGSFSVDWLPKIEVGTVELKNRSHSSITYRVKASQLELECELLKKVSGADWTAISHLLQPSDNSGDRRDLHFQWNGCHLHVMIAADRENADYKEVSSMLYPLLNSLPFPTDSGLVEFNDFRELQLIACTKMNLPQATDYFDAEMKRHGWLASPSGRKVTDELCWLPFFQGQRDITIGLDKLADGRTLVQAGKYSNSSWLELLLKTKQDEIVPVQGDAGMQAADFPILGAATPVSYDTASNDIRFELDATTDLLALNAQYIEKFQELGWSSTPIGDATANDFNMVFKRDALLVYLSVRRSPGTKRTFHAIATSKDFRWTKPIPITDSRMTYIDWLKQKRAYATLERVDEFQREMNELLNKQSPSLPNLQ